MAALGVRIRDSHLTVADMRGLVTLAENQGYDSVWLMADAIKRAGSTNPDDITAALAATKFSGARGEYSFSRDSEPGWRYQQFLDAPISVIQYSEVGESPSDALILAPDRWATAETILAPG